MNPVCAAFQVLQAEEGDSFTHVQGRYCRMTMEFYHQYFLDSPRLREKFHQLYTAYRTLRTFYSSPENPEDSLLPPARRHQILYNHALHHIIEKMEQRALTILRQCRKLHPSHSLTLVLMAGVLYNLGRYSRAAESAKSAVRIEDRNPQAWAILAKCHLQKGKPASGRILLETAARIRPDRRLSGIITGLYHRDKGKMESRHDILISSFLSSGWT